MVEPISVAAATFALLGEGVLLAVVVALARQARHLDDEGPRRLLWIAVPLLAIGMVTRVARYASGTRGGWDTLAALVAGAAAWYLVWRAAHALPGTPASARAGGLVLAATAIASIVLQAGAGSFGVTVQLLLGVAFGFTAAFLATLGWRMRAAGEGGLVANLAVLAALIAASAPWIRALVIYSAQGGDFALFGVARLVLAGLLTFAALLAWPAADVETARLARPPAAQPEPGAPDA